MPGQGSCSGSLFSPVARFLRTRWVIRKSRIARLRSPARSTPARCPNVCGVPPELLAAIVEEFDQAKHTLQELADERRATVENVRQTLDLTNGQIRAAFEISRRDQHSLRATGEQARRDRQKVQGAAVDRSSAARRHARDHRPQGTSGSRNQSRRARQSGRLACRDRRQAGARPRTALRPTAPPRLPAAATWRLDACATWMRRSTSRTRRTRCPAGESLCEPAARLRPAGSFGAVSARRGIRRQRRTGRRRSNDDRRLLESTPRSQIAA